MRRFCGREQRLGRLRDVVLRCAGGCLLEVETMDEAGLQLEIVGLHLAGESTLKVATNE